MQQKGKKSILTLFSSINRKKLKKEFVSFFLFFLSFLCVQYPCGKWKESKKPFFQISNNNSTYNIKNKNKKDQQNPY